MMGYGIVDALGSVAMGVLSDRFGRAPVALLGCALQCSIAATLLFWTPTAGQHVPPIIMALVLGLGDSTSQVVAPALCTAAFEPTEVRFASTHAWFLLHFFVTNNQHVFATALPDDGCAGCVSRCAGAWRSDHFFGK